MPARRSFLGPRTAFLTALCVGLVWFCLPFRSRRILAEDAANTATETSTQRDTYDKWLREFRALAKVYLGDVNPPALTNAQLSALLQTRPSWFEAGVRDVIRARGQEAVFTEVRDMLRADEEAWRGFYSLSHTSFVRRHPLRTVQVAEHMRAPILRMMEEGQVQDVVNHAAPLIDVPAPPATQSAPRLDSPEDVADFCEAVLRAAAKERKAAFRHYSRDELSFVYEAAPAFMRKLVDHLYLSVPELGSTVKRREYYRLYEDARGAKKSVARARAESQADAEAAYREACERLDAFRKSHADAFAADEQLYKNNVRLLELTKKTAYGALLRSANLICSLAHPETLRQIHGALAKLGGTTNSAGETGQAILLRRETELGTIVIGGAGANTYDGECAVILDVGGDDRYAGQAGAGYSEERPFGVVIDFSGDDHYGTGGQNASDYSQGAGLCGVGLLVDLAGSDRYESGLCAQGAGCLGVGILCDMDGDDTYRGKEWCQGASAFGLGILLDQGGSDRYHANSYCQAFGGTKGLGLLVDAEGNDRYVCGDAHPSMFGTPDTFDGHGQGSGMGLRSMSPERPASAHGGVGMLIDMAGNDTYRGGEFSGGVGYSHAFGMLIDNDGDDAYNAGHFGCGAGVHSGIGLVVDQGRGDDEYTARSVNTRGAAWDLAAAFLVDDGGEDEYEYGSHGLAAANQNGLAIVWGKTGTALPVLDESAEARRPENTFRNGRSLGIRVGH